MLFSRLELLNKGELFKIINKYKIQQIKEIKL